MEPFDKSKATSYLIKIFDLGPEPGFLQQLKCIEMAAEFLQKIHDQAFEAGFEAGMEADKKVNDL